MDENHPMNPRSPYAAAKAGADRLVYSYYCTYKVPAVIVRPFNNYGPGLKISDRRALPDFARDILANRNIVLYSDGSPTRTFCYVADAIVGYFKILVRGESGEAYNIGVDKPEISIMTLAETTVELSRHLLDYKGEIVSQVSEDEDYLVDNPNRRCPVITKARTGLGYNPSISLDEGLKRSLLWYRDNPSAEDA